MFNNPNSLFFFKNDAKGFLPPNFNYTREKSFEEKVFAKHFFNEIFLEENSDHFLRTFRDKRKIE